MTHTESNIAGKEEKVHIDDNCCMARVYGDSKHPGRQCRHKKSRYSPNGDYCKLHGKQAEVTTEPLQMQDITISQADNENLTKSKLQYGLFMGRIDQPRPQLNDNGQACLIWPDQYRQGDKIYWREDDTLVTDNWHPLEARYHKLHKTHPEVIQDNSTQSAEDSDPFDWEYMTNGTGGCAKCGRQDVPLTSSIEDGRLYAPDCWDEFAWEWSYLNPNSIWRDNEHKSFTLTVEDIYRANNPRPFGHMEDDTEDIESLTDRSVDHMQNIPHTSHDEDRESEPTLQKFQNDNDYYSDENVTLQVDELAERQENTIKVDFLNHIIIGLKKDIHSISRLIMKFEKNPHPAMVESLSQQAEKLYLQYGSAWKPFFLQSNCENNQNKTLHQKKFNELINFYDCMTEEYSITSVTECNNLLYLRHYNIQETIEQPTTFQEEVWSKYDEFTVELMEEEIEQLKQKLHSKLNSRTYITHIISCFFNIPTPELEFAEDPSHNLMDMVLKLQSKDVPCIFNSTAFCNPIQNWHDHIDLVIETLIETWFGSLHTAPMPPSRYAKLVQIDEQIRWLQTQRPEDGGLHYNYDHLLIPCL